MNLNPTLNSEFEWISYFDIPADEAVYEAWRDISGKEVLLLLLIEVGLYVLNSELSTGAGLTHAVLSYAGVLSCETNGEG